MVVANMEALQILDRKKNPTASLPELRAAQLELMQAISFFKRLSKLPEQALAQRNIKPKNLRLHEEFCHKAVKQVEARRVDEEKAKAAREVWLVHNSIPLIFVHGFLDVVDKLRSRMKYI
jgi:hypothetical protein